jgi:hypothetical protein
MSWRFWWRAEWTCRRLVGWRSTADVPGHCRAGWNSLCRLITSGRKFQLVTRIRHGSARPDHLDRLEGESHGPARPHRHQVYARIWSKFPSVVMLGPDPGICCRARQVARVDVVRACNDPLVRPDDDDGEQILPCLELNLMPVRLDRARTSNEQHGCAGNTDAHISNALSSMRVRMGKSVGT